MGNKAITLENDDLSNLFCKQSENEGIWFQMKDKDGNEWDIDLLIFGNDSDVVQKYNRKSVKEKLKNMTVSKSGRVQFTGEALDDDEDIEATLVKLGGVRKHSTQEPLKMNGADFPMLKDSKSLELYRTLIDGSPDIKEFVNAQAAERGDFLAHRKKN